MGQQGAQSQQGSLTLTLSPIAGASCVPKLSNFKMIKLLGSGPNFGNVLRVKNRTSGMHEAAISVFAADLFVYWWVKTTSFLALKFQKARKDVVFSCEYTERSAANTEMPALCKLALTLLFTAVLSSSKSPRKTSAFSLRGSVAALAPPMMILSA